MQEASNNIAKCVACIDNYQEVGKLCHSCATNTDVHICRDNIYKEAYAELKHCPACKAENNEEPYPGYVPLVSLKTSVCRSQVDAFRASFNIPPDFTDERIFEAILGDLIDRYFNVEYFSPDEVQNLLTDNLDERWIK